MRDFLCFGGEDRAEGVPCGSRVGVADIRRGSHACVGNGVILSDIIERRLPAFYAGFSVFLAERTEMKRFLVVRVSALPTYAEGPALAWETALSCPILSKDAYPHSMRDFLCFGGEDRAEEVPCGSRA